MPPIAVPVNLIGLFCLNQPVVVTVNAPLDAVVAVTLSA